MRLGGSIRNQPGVGDEPYFRGGRNRGGKRFEPFGVVEEVARAARLAGEQDDRRVVDVRNRLKVAILPDREARRA